MATPSPAEPPPGEPNPPPAKVEHRDSRGDFIPEASLHGRYESGGSISQLGQAEPASSLRFEGAEPLASSYRPRSVPGSPVADIVVVAALALGALAFVVWRHFQREARENFAGQDHNKD